MTRVMYSAPGFCPVWCFYLKLLSADIFNMDALRPFKVQKKKKRKMKIYHVREINFKKHRVAFPYIATLCYKNGTLPQLCKRNFFCTTSFFLWKGQVPSSVSFLCSSVKVFFLHYCMTWQSNTGVSLSSVHFLVLCVYVWINTSWFNDFKLIIFQYIMKPL